MASVPRVVLIHGGPIPANLLTPPEHWLVFESFERPLGTFDRDRFQMLLQARSGRWRRCRHSRPDRTRVPDAALPSVDATRRSLWAFSGRGPFLGPYLRDPPVRDTPDAIRCVLAYYAALRYAVILRGIATPPKTRAASHLSSSHPPGLTGRN